jgi:hypothetical protein
METPAINLLSSETPVVDPINHLMGKIGEVLAACATLKARVDIMEDHLVFLLSNSPKYLDLMQKRATGEKPDEENKKEPIQ